MNAKSLTPPAMAIQFVETINGQAGLSQEQRYTLLSSFLSILLDQHWQHLSKDNLALLPGERRVIWSGTHSGLMEIFSNPQNGYGFPLVTQGCGLVGGGGSSGDKIVEGLGLLQLCLQLCAKYELQQLLSIPAEKRSNDLQKIAAWANKVLSKTELVIKALMYSANGLVDQVKQPKPSIMRAVGKLTGYLQVHRALGETVQTAQVLADDLLQAVYMLYTPMSAKYTETLRLCKQVEDESRTSLDALSRYRSGLLQQASLLAEYVGISLPKTTKAIAAELWQDMSEKVSERLKNDPLSRVEIEAMSLYHPLIRFLPHTDYYGSEGRDVRAVVKATVIASLVKGSEKDTVHDPERVQTSAGWKIEEWFSRASKQACSRAFDIDFTGIAAYAWAEQLEYFQNKQKELEAMPEGHRWTGSVVCRWLLPASSFGLESDGNVDISMKLLYTLT